MNPNREIGEAATALRKQIMLLVRRMRRESATYELPLSHLMLLSRIDQLGDKASPTLLAETESLRPQNLSALLRKLEQLGLTFKVNDPHDKRKSCIKLSTEGLAMLEKTRNSRDHWLTHAMAVTLNQQEIKQLTEAGQLLERLATALPAP